MVVITRQLTHPFHHRGHQSEGPLWHNWALNRARQQLHAEYSRTLTFRSLVEKYHFTAEEERTVRQKLDVVGTAGGVAGAFSHDSAVTCRWKGERQGQAEYASTKGFELEVTEMSIVPGTDRTHTKKNKMGERTWQCACTIRYTLIMQVF